MAVLHLSLWLFCLATLGGGNVNPARAGEEPMVRVYFFWAKGCIHCLEEKKFLARLQQDLPFVDLVDFEVTTSAAHRDLLLQVTRLFRVELAGVPFTVVGDRSFVGWQGDRVTGAAIQQALVEARNRGGPDVVAALLAQPPPGARPERVPHRLVVPLLGEIDLRTLSLATITLLMGALDGFNPCAMWALVFLISLLWGLPDRRRRWALGSVFILGSGVVYFLFMAAWLNIFLFLGLVWWLRLGIGAVALGAGTLNLTALYRDRSGSCPLAGGGRRRSFLENIQRAVERQSFWLALGGVFLLGVAVNLVELFCSLGLPVIYTQILTLSNLPAWQYYAFLLLYIAVFMLDDLVVFVVSMLTLEHLGLTQKYQRFSHAVGGLALLVIGVVLIFKPEWLRFW